MERQCGLLIRPCNGTRSNSCVSLLNHLDLTHLPYLLHVSPGDHFVKVHLGEDDVFVLLKVLRHSAEYRLVADHNDDLMMRIWQL